MDLETRKLLVDGARAIQNGKREEGQNLLMQYVEKDEQSEEAWLWLSGALDDPDDIEVALDNCLSLNPNNIRALQGKDWLEEYRHQKSRNKY